MKTLGSLLQIPPKTTGPETLYIVGLVTVLSFIHMLSFLGRVGAARKKFKVLPPKIEGPAGFNLVYRAHQNSLEFYPMFLAGLWGAAIFFHQVPAAIVGVFYLVSREIYFSGYSKAAEGRLVGFLLSSLNLLLLFVMAGLGAGTIGYHAYTGRHFLKGWLQYFPVPFL